MKDFSTAARAELARLGPATACCVHAELGGVIRAAGSLHLHGAQQISLSVTTEHPDVARKVVTLLRALAGEEVEVTAEEHEILRRHRSYHVQLKPGTGIKHLLIDLGLLTADGQIQSEIPSPLVRKACCRGAFLRGAYMMRGSVCDPRGRGYHLEIVAVNEEFGLGLVYLMNLARFKAHLAQRKGQYVVYLKDADDIASFLSLIGAQAARLEFEEVRVVRELRGEVNRLVNAETANVDKAVSAAMEQVELIELLQAAGILARLPQALREVAQARLANPEASLAELGESLPQPVSKSAVNDRLRRLRKYAERLMVEELE